MLTAIRSRGLLIEQSGLKGIVVSDSSARFSSNPAYEAEDGGSFNMFCMDKERPTEWTATSENFMPHVRLIGDRDPSINMQLLDEHLMTTYTRN